jgi:predicted enzyme related to lactoylglutathione lyase
MATLTALVVAATKPAALARFWSALLGWCVAAESPNEAVVQAPADDGWDLDLVFAAAAVPKTSQNRIHLDLSSSSGRNQRETAERAMSLGARTVDIGQGDVPWTVLADPEGNEFCVLEPRAEYAESGAVAAIVVEAQSPGRLARFWSPLISWPVVAESPEIATLRHSFGHGPAIEFLREERPKTGENRLRFDLAPGRDTDRSGEIRRLLDAGATAGSLDPAATAGNLGPAATAGNLGLARTARNFGPGATAGNLGPAATVGDLGPAAVERTVFADPEGNEFRLLASSGPHVSRRSPSERKF